MWYVIKKQEFGYLPVKASAGFTEKTIAEEVRQKLERIAKRNKITGIEYVVEQMWQSTKNNTHYCQK